MYRTDEERGYLIDCVYERGIEHFVELSHVDRDKIKKAGVETVLPQSPFPDFEVYRVHFLIEGEEKEVLVSVTSEWIQERLFEFYTRKSTP